MIERILKKTVFLTALLTIFSLPWRASVQVGQVGSIGRVIGLFFIASWLMYFIIYKDSIEISTYIILISLFLTLFVLSTFWSLNPTNSFLSSIRFFSVIALTIAMWDFFNDEYKIFTGLQTLVAGGYISVLGTIFVYYSSSGSHFRQAFHGYNVNYMAGTLVVLLPISVLLVRSNHYDNIGFQIINLLFIPLCTIAIIITGSRMGLVALAPFLVLLIYHTYNDYTYSFTKMLIFMVLVLIPATNYLNIITQERINYFLSIPMEIISGDIGGARGEIWTGGLYQGLEAPIFGHGARSFSYAVSTPNYAGASAHNSFIQIFVDLGIVGLLLYISIILFVMRYALNSKYRSEWMAFVIIYLTICMANNFELNIIMWFLFTLCARCSIVSNLK